MYFSKLAPSQFNFLLVLITESVVVLLTQHDLAQLERSMVRSTSDSGVERYAACRSGATQAFGFKHNHHHVAHLNAVWTEGSDYRRRARVSCRYPNPRLVRAPGSLLSPPRRFKVAHVGAHTAVFVSGLGSREPLLATRSDAQRVIDTNAASHCCSKPCPASMFQSGIESEKLVLPSL